MRIADSECEPSGRPVTSNVSHTSRPKGRSMLRERTVVLFDLGDFDESFSAANI